MNHKVMKVLLSIKPKYAESIFDGSKKYEFRKAIFKNSNVKSVVVYASSPVQKVIGEFEIEKVLKASPNELWSETKEFSGITESFFNSYFGGREVGYAIKVKKVRRFKKPKCLKTFYKVTPPQSFCYI